MRAVGGRSLASTVKTWRSLDSVDEERFGRRWTQSKAPQSENWLGGRGGPCAIENSAGGSGGNGGLRWWRRFSSNPHHNRICTHLKAHRP